MAGTGMADATTNKKVEFPRDSAGGDRDAQKKYLIITGGTISGLGKGTTISSIGVLLRSHGLRVTAMKIDPYLNVDAGTMSPFEHGEVYVLEDGGEADLDLGNYERFLEVTLTSAHSLTSGKIYEHVIKQERVGNYLGKTVQMVPHVTDAIQDWMTNVASKPVDKSGKQPEVCLVELGGTVGDIESAVYLEALQQFQFRVGRENFLMVHLAMLPYVSSTGEQKTKPCQHSVKLLREAGLKPDILMCRSEKPIDEATRKKLSLFCQVPPDSVISLHDVANLYHVPLLLAEQDVGHLICEHFKFPSSSDSPRSRVAPTLTFAASPLSTGMAEQRLADWKIIADRASNCEQEVVIALVGKYVGNPDAYVSVTKALQHAALEAGLRLVVRWVDSSALEPNVEQLDPPRNKAAWEALRSAQGVLVPGGFGNRGIEGKVATANYCRKALVPYLGICVGFQTAVIDFARSELGWESANSTEFDELTSHPVVVFLPESSTTVLGGTMRLGSRATIIQDQEALACKVYGGQPVVYERHRHRYEVNAACVPAFESRGLHFAGQDDRGQRMELCEVRDHPYFLACQFHPEFKSSPARPAPLFLGLVLAAAGRLGERLQSDGGVLRAGAGYGAAGNQMQNLASVDCDWKAWVPDCSA